MSEFQSPDTNGATIHDGYSYADVQGYSSELSRQAVPRRVEQGPGSLLRYRFVKRGQDLLITFFLLPLLIPVLIAVALLVRLSSPGPIFYSHRRIRRNGAFFSMWKFRTMCIDSTEVLERHLEQNAEARMEWNRTHKLKSDPRVTALGNFLRRYSLDELPQIWNVFRGQMSLVGPRPIVAAEVEKYAEGFDCYCKVKPGVTGLWQVSGRSKLTYAERVALDCKYVARWSLSLDGVILLKTFLTVLRQDGAF